MILDASTTVKVIRHTIQNLKMKSPQYESEPARSILVALEELAKSFDMITTSKITAAQASKESDIGKHGYES